MKVSAKFKEKRKEGEEESDEEKKKLDTAFAAALKTLKTKLANEKAMEGHVFKVREYLIQSINKKRSELLQEKKEAAAKPGVPAGATQIAPGINLPLPTGHPVVKKAAVVPVKPKKSKLLNPEH